jgi:hypothetical protein
VKAIADAIAGVVMPRDSRQALVDAVAGVLEETTPKDRAGNVKPDSAFTGRKRKAFEQAAASKVRLEIVVSVWVNSDGAITHQDWELRVWEDHWSHMTVKRPKENSFAGIVSLACKEHFVRDLAQVPIRFEKH